MGENGSFSGAATELNNTYPTARTLFNIINSVTVTQSTAGFMNWQCDSNTNFTKGIDLSTGLNYDAELSNTISTNFGFPRLSDTTARSVRCRPTTSPPRTTAVLLKSR